MFCGFVFDADYTNNLYASCLKIREETCLDLLRQCEEHQQHREEGEEGTAGGVEVGHGCRGDRPLLLGPVAERGVAAGDAHRVQPPCAELLVAGGGDETRCRGGAGLSIMYSCTEEECCKINK